MEEKTLEMRFDVSTIIAVDFVLRLMTGKLEYHPEDDGSMPSGMLPAPVWGDFRFFSRITATRIVKNDFDLRRTVSFFLLGQLVAEVYLEGLDSARYAPGWAVARVRYLKSNLRPQDDQWTDVRLYVGGYECLCGYTEEK